MNPSNEEKLLKEAKARAERAEEKLHRACAAWRGVIPALRTVRDSVDAALYACGEAASIPAFRNARDSVDAALYACVNAVSRRVFGVAGRLPSGVDARSESWVSGVDARSESWVESRIQKFTDHLRHGSRQDGGDAVNPSNDAGERLAALSRSGVALNLENEEWRRVFKEERTRAEQAGQRLNVAYSAWLVIRPRVFAPGFENSIAAIDKALARTEVTL